MNIKLHSLATSSMDGAAGVLSEGFLGEHGRLAGVPAFPGLQPHHRTAFLERFEPLRETKRSATPETELPWLMWYRSPEHRSAFEESWNTLVASVTDIVWLENNASTFFKPTATEAAAVTNADLVNLREYAHQALARSTSNARARTQLFPVPQGSFISQGELYDGNMPAIPEWRSTWGPLHGYHLVDVVWMQLNPGASSTQRSRVYNQLHSETSTLPGFVKAV
ncbi:hypothetical protein F4824DRAFT_500319 [Ustulina deusta]|nr:hypothetical protein F4824DRAFT_500319 [Ustulina deusta]